MKLHEGGVWVWVWVWVCGRWWGGPGRGGAGRAWCMSRAKCGRVEGEVRRAAGLQLREFEAGRPTAQVGKVCPTRFDDQQT